jgi:hypothetical protein
MTQTLMKTHAVRKAFQAIDAADHMIAHAIRRMEEAIPDLPTQQERLYQGERLRLIRLAVGLPRPDTFALLLAVLHAPPDTDAASYEAMVSKLYKAMGWKREE